MSDRKQHSKRLKNVPGQSLPPVIILGGEVNALSMGRSLASLGIKVHLIAPENCPARYSRHISPIELDDYSAKTILSWLCGNDSCHFRQSVLLSASDWGSRLLAESYNLLKSNYQIDVFSPTATLSMLNKLETYRLASEANVLTPKYWFLDSTSDIREIKQELLYPLIIKPEYTYEFLEKFGEKFLVAEKFEDVLEAMRIMEGVDTRCMLVEIIPGPDSNLYNYHTYIDENGVPLYEFTKGILRRYPVMDGSACYHITQNKPEIRKQSLRFFNHVKISGVTNVEFKYDPRDESYKLIECNIRFTAPTGMIIEPGEDQIDLAKFVYFRIIGEPIDPPQHFKENDRMWFPVEDFRCFLSLRRQNELSLREWMGSALKFPKLPYFRFSDLGPSLYIASLLSRQVIGKAVKLARKPFN